MGLARKSHFLSIRIQMVSSSYGYMPGPVLGLALQERVQIAGSADQEFRERAPTERSA